MINLAIYSCFSKNFIILPCSDQIAFHLVVNLAYYLVIILAKAYVQKHLSKQDLFISLFKTFGILDNASDLETECDDPF